MSNVRKTVIALTVENEANNKNNEAVRSNETNEMEKSHRKLRLLALKALDHLFVGVLLLSAVWEFVYESEYLKTIAGAIVAVVLELFMWVIFAGVSILMTAMFIPDDIHHRNRNKEKLDASLNEQDGTVSSETDANTEQLKITEN